VKTSLALAAFAIAATVAAYKSFLTKPTSATQKAFWAVAAAVCAIAIITILAEGRRGDVIYRVRVTVVDAHNVPVDGAVVRVTAANEAKTAPDGSAELAIPRGSLPQDGGVTIYVDKEAAFLHGSKQLTLGGDPNPSITIAVVASETAEVSGAVQDDSGHAVAGARVTVPGGEAVSTDADGNFKLPAHAARDQKVLIHAEKSGYTPTSQYHPAGDGRAVLVLRHETHPRRKTQ
jgi:predicted RecA/RadA family phage recombinase